MRSFIKKYAAVVLLTGIFQPVFAQVKPNGTTAPASATAVAAPAAFSGVTVNYVRTREAVAPISVPATIDSANYLRVKQTTQYIDGIGRPLQTVLKQASPALKDMVSPVTYDAYGREQYKYMPYVSTGDNGNFKLSPYTEQATFMSSQFPGESIYYAETQFENSPLSRTLKTLAPGNSWGGAGKGTAMAYLINETSDSVRIWNIAMDTLLYNSGDSAINVPSSSAMYGAGQLFKTQTIDEHGSSVIEYKDRDGKVILKKVQLSSSPGSAHVGWLCTYYVYDDFGSLRFVIPPKAVAIMQGNGNWSLTVNAVVNELCFRYEYDARKRMTAKKVPGAGWVYMVYDKRDRLAFTQDANMRVNNQWLATLYDLENRQASTGMITYSGNRGALAWILDKKFELATATTVTLSFMAPDSLFVNERIPGKPVYRAKSKIVFTGDFETEPGAATETILDTATLSTTAILVDYDPFPGGANFKGLTVNYYDDYAFTSKAYNAGFSSVIDAGENRFVESLPTTASLLIRGMPTGNKVRILSNPSDLDEGAWMESASFYDDKGRMVQSQSENYSNGTDVATMRYDFTGKAVTTYQVHNNAIAGQTVKTKTNIQFDHAGRLLSVKKTLNNDDATTRWIERNGYDELGQLVQKRVGQKLSSDTSAMEVLDNTYNIRGWLQGVNRDYSRGTGSKWFGMELNYDWGFTANQFNGNIAGQQWRSKGDGEQRAFGYSYDNANRILSGDFTQYTSSAWNTGAGLDFSLSGMSYDANGNIASMKQKGWKINASTVIDSLLYTYNTNSNKLLNVIDLANDTATRLGDFRSSKTYMTALSNSKTNTATDYSYDNNGNLLKDLNKDIGSSAASGITYNHLNLPFKVWVKGKGTITYYYDATGNKLEKRTYDSTISLLTKTTYLNGSVYQNDTLQFFGHEEGRIRKKPDNSFVYDYFLKDHLGNTRMVLTEEVQQDVYPVATLEIGATDVEGQYYAINTGVIVSNPASIPSTYANNNGNPPYNSNPTSVVTATSAKMYKLNGASGDKTGLGMALKVMSGDNVAVYGRSFWHGSSPTNSYSTVVNDLLTALAGAGAVAGSGKSITAGALTGSATIPTEVATQLSTATVASGAPKAYINWILFDEQFKVVSASSGFDAVNTSADALKTHSFTVDVSKNGYLYVYCSNESNQDVFFDNLQLIHNRGPLLEENHFYAFGLTMAGISSKAAGKLENKKNKFQGQEYNDDLGVDLYEFKYRMDDPQTGRFWQVDPLASDYVYNSTYAFSENKVTNHVELEGLEAVPAGTPMNYLSNAFSSMTQALAHTVDKVTNLFTNTKMEVTVPTSSNTSMVTTSSSTTTIGSNFTAWIFGANTGSVPTFKAETKTETKIETKIEFNGGAVGVSSKVNADGSSSELKGQVKTNVYGVPITASLSQATNNSTSETKTTGKLATGAAGTNGFAQVEIVNTPKKTTTNVSVGLETTNGATKASISIGRAL